MINGTFSTLHRLAAVGLCDLPCCRVERALIDVEIDSVTKTASLVKIEGGKSRGFVLVRMAE